MMTCTCGHCMRACIIDGATRLLCYDCQRVTMLDGSPEPPSALKLPGLDRGKQSRRTHEMESENRRQNKYNNQKSECTFGHLHDSRKESMRCEYLHFQQKALEISKLELQPIYDLVVNGQKICTYRADFRYEVDDQFPSQKMSVVVEDVKSSPTKTPVYRLKKKLMKAVLGIDIREV